MKVKPDDVHRVLSDVRSMKGKQESFNSKLDNLKRYVCLSAPVSLSLNSELYNREKFVCPSLCLKSKQNFNFDPCDRNASLSFFLPLQNPSL